MYDTARRVALVKKRRHEYARRKQQREICGLSAACMLLFAALLFFAALLPVLLAMVPGAWVPTRWSDFGFWAALGKSAAARVDAWFALPPQYKDIAVKWLLLEQGALCLAGCLFALRRPPAPRNEKAVEA